MSANGFVLPGSDDQPFRKSLIPDADQGDVTGDYTLLVHHSGDVVCETPVQVALPQLLAPHHRLRLRAQARERLRG